jgi:hypothetical protein
MMLQHDSFTDRQGRRSGMRLEPTFKEEKEILDIQADISDAEGTGAAIDSLIRKREQIIESWIARVTKEISNAGHDHGKAAALRIELDRANHFMRLKFEHRARCH